MGHLTDTRTGDALVVAPSEFQVLSAVGLEFDADQPDVAQVLLKYRPFYVEAVEKSALGAFYELDLEDAPTMPQIPSIAPVTMELAAVAAPPAEEEPLPSLELMNEPETTEHPAFEAPPSEEDFTQPRGVGAALLPPPIDPVTREETLEQAQHPQHTEEVSAADVAAAIGSASSMGEPSVAPEFAVSAPRSSARPLVLALAGVTLLVVAVAATFALRPRGETTLPEALNPTTVVDAGVAAVVIDAGVPELVDSGTPEAVVDAGAMVAEPIIDAGAASATFEVDAGAPDQTEWLSADVQARGRVKMGEVTAGAEGEVSWTVAEEERVKAKQVIGSVAREGGEPVPVTASSVGLVMLKQPAGAKVKRGAVLAEIFYFEAWAKGTVKGAAPKMGWRCEVSSAALQQQGECKISVVTPKGTGAVVTVAIEPRWFDGATDAVLRFAP